MKNSKKLNNSCIKIFKLLQLVYEDNAEYEKVITIFQDEIKDSSTNNIQVTLNKYLNTLKVFGIKIEKENNKFKLKSSLYTMQLTIDDIKALGILSNSINNFPNENLKEEISELITNLKLRMSNKDKQTLDSLSKNIDYEFDFYYSNLKEQINTCEQLCKDKFLINIIYERKNKQETCKCIPKELIYNSKNVILKVYKNESNQYLEIPLNSIISINKLPQISNNIELGTTVVFKLKNRLAKSYKLKENEYSDGFDNEGNLIVINKNESLDKLIQRLLRYSSNCEIISPKHLRQKMISIITQTLNNYDD